ncbi:hypothetical protein Pmani_022804 [Petrolisthes manimaculis]|uniref:Uncharacterized protein n=1 Tax=Petrolisthes manimaculis TaxID=1843537 RepID=A0AAE1U0T3_9EUCA|nr:hypothetical protein Pmani_022804 [Petrolisthes manimaculis]
MDCWTPEISHYFHGMTHHAPGMSQLVPGTSYYPWNDPLPLNSPLERPTIDLECLCASGMYLVNSVVLDGDGVEVSGCPQDLGGVLMVLTHLPVS